MQIRLIDILILGALSAFSFGTGHAQKVNYGVHGISLPAELSDAENQYSALSTHRKELYLMPECRVLEGQESKLYIIPLAELEKHMNDTSYSYRYRKIPIMGFEKLVQDMLKQKQVCEGLEAMVIKNKQVYFSVETTGASDYVYLLKGKMERDRVVLDSNFLLPIYKPRDGRGQMIYNASFECLEWYKGRLYVFFEFNYFDRTNYVYSYNGALDASSIDSFPIDKMPYRIADLKRSGPNDFVAINSFYKGGGKDTINRPHVADTANYNLVNDGNKFHDYARLVLMEFKKGRFSWETLFVMPKEYEGVNWEGLATYKKGFFMVNDKYTAKKPYYSVLVYLKKTRE